MNSATMDRIDAEARNGFPRLRGTHIAGAIPVTQAVIDEVVADFPVVPEVQVLDGGQIVATVWGKSVRATIVGISPSLTLTLAVPWWARMLAAMAPHTRVERDVVLVELGAFPRVATYQYLWKHLTSIDIRTTTGRLTVSFELVIV
jgi:hypothetical protein